LIAARSGNDAKKDARPTQIPALPVAPIAKVARFTTVCSDK
jgi:hypothetical protein